MNESQPRWKTVGLWTLSILLGVMFIFSGASKLAGVEMHVESFARWGLPDWFRSFTGAVEVLGGLLLLVPRMRFWGGGLIAATMVGAALTHIVSGVEVSMVGLNAVLFTVAALLAWSQRPQFLRRQDAPRIEPQRPAA